ncbi:MAG: AAA family ATPase [Coriobacteriia bacterium]|nr:AAA family ATPase [Coriobacteriia bacterium]
MKACADNGLEVDNANKNPSRLSRLPGIRRGEGWQYIVDTGIGKATYEEWLAWRDEQADGLPDAVSFADEAGVAVADPDVLIEGVLAKGEKLLLAGPSKAGKSFALLQLCVAFAEGLDWLGLSCQQTDVLYVNLELKAESRKRRMQDIYRALGIEPINARRIHSMDLRGKLVDLDRLTAKLVRQAVSTDCKVVIIDPIYKVLHGDENSSEDVSRFCVALDYLVDRLGVSVIYCHHYSKGASAYASSMNRASGSSVFSRDADALVTLDEIELTEPMRQARFNTLGCALVAKAMDGLAAPGWRNSLKGPDDLLALDRLRADMVQILGHGTEAANNLIVELDRLEGACMETLSAWRVEGTLRDFPKLAPFEAWYDWPLHSVDDSGVLKDAVEDGAKAYRNGQKATVKETYEQKASRVLGNAYTLLTAQGVPPEKVTTGGLAEAAGCSKDTIVRYLDVVKTFERDPKTGVVTVITRKDEGAEKASLRGAAGGFE